METEIRPVEPLHVLSQDGQPYGSQRRCCNYCGQMLHRSMDGAGHRWTDDWAAWEASGDSCEVWKEG